MSRYCRPLALLLLVAALPATAWADRDYRVEVIVFEQSGGNRAGEQWPDPPPPVGFEHYARLDGDATSVTPERFRERPGGELGHRNVAAALDRSGTYRLHLHAGWVQPGVDRAAARAVALPPGRSPRPPGLPALDADGDGGDDSGRGVEPGAEPPEGLSGGVRVWRGRHLHVEVDLRLYPEAGEDADVVTMQARQRVDRDTLTYVDHPELGVLVYIERAGD